MAFPSETKSTPGEHSGPLTPEQVHLGRLKSKEQDARLSLTQKKIPLRTKSSIMIMEIIL